MAAELTDKQKEELAKRLWISSNPAVAKQYAMDPRTQAANSMLSSGMNTAPAVGGFAEGIGRLGSGIAGGLIAKQQMGKYGDAEGRMKQVENATIAPTAAALGAPPALPNAEPLPAGPLAPPISTPVTTPPPGLQQPDIPPPLPPQEGPPIPPNVQVANALGGAPPGAGPPPSVGTAPPPPAIQNPTMAPAARRGATTASLSPRRAVSTIPPTTGEDGRPGYAPRVQRVAAAREGRFGGKDDPYGSWGAVYGYGAYGRPPKPIPEMSIGEVIDFGKRSLIPTTRAAGIGKNSKGKTVGTSAVGGLQFVGSTLEELAPSVLGPRWREQTFTTGVQDLLGKKLFDQRKHGNLKATWEGLPDSTPGAYKNTPWEQMRPLIMKYESGAGGQPGAVGAGGGGGVDGDYYIAEPDYVEPAPLPDAPIKPERPPVQQAVASARWEVANRLLGMDTSGLGPGQLGAIQQNIEANYGPAFDETKEARMQQDRQEAALTNVGYQNEMNNWSQKDVNRYGAEIGRTTGDEELNRQLLRDRYSVEADVYKREDEQQAARDAAELAAVRDEAEKKREREHALAIERIRGDSKRQATLSTRAGIDEFNNRMEGQQQGRELTQAGREVLAIINAGTTTTGGFSRRGLTGTLQKSYDAGLEKLDGLRNTIVRGQLGGKLGSGISNADVEFITSTVPIGKESNPTLVREYAEKIQLAGKRQEDYNHHAYDAFESGTRGDFNRRWKQYSDETRLYTDSGKARWTVDTYPSYSEWLETAMASGGVK